METMFTNDPDRGRTERYLFIIIFYNCENALDQYFIAEFY